MGNNGLRWCMVYLGFDIWMFVESLVFVLLVGIVYSVQNNCGICDYGLILIFEYKIDEGLSFYILYGYFS